MLIYLIAAEDKAVKLLRTKHHHLRTCQFNSYPTEQKYSSRVARTEDGWACDIHSEASNSVLQGFEINS